MGLSKRQRAAVREYALRKGWKAHTEKLDAQAVGEQIELIARDNDGAVSASNVVAAAKAKSSPMHGAFDWDDTAAAAQWRLDQARDLVRCVRVIVVDEAGERQEQPQMVNVVVQHDHRGKVQEYRRAIDVVQQPDAYASALQELRRHIEDTERAVAELRRMASDLPERQATLAAVADALATARTVAATLH
jgi:hypothetical protein